MSATDTSGASFFFFFAMEQHRHSREIVSLRRGGAARSTTTRNEDGSGRLFFHFSLCSTHEVLNHFKYNIVDSMSETEILLYLVNDDHAKDSYLHYRRYVEVMD